MSQESGRALYSSKLSWAGIPFFVKMVELDQMILMVPFSAEML